MNGKPLPYRLRLFNRTLAVILAVVCVVECSKFLFGTSQDSVRSRFLSNEAVADSLPQRDTLKSAEANVLPRSRDADLRHVFAQKDTALAHAMDTYLRRFRPLHAFYLAVDPLTNEIVAWGERKDSAVQSEPDYLSRATFPAASLAKTVTIAAAFESGRYSNETAVPLIGRAHTLYKKQVQVPANYSGPIAPVHLAYAKSYNPPIALIGMNVGAKRLKSAAEKFGFNRNFPQGIPERSHYAPPDSGYGLAEVSSGFTEETTLSPLQAAAMVRAVLTGKALEIPWEKDGAGGYAPTKPIKLDVSKFSDATYRELRAAMIATAKEGTARKQFSSRNIARRFLNEFDFGGKTGSLDGKSPAGRYDWFMGFAKSRKDPQKSLIVVVMQVHGKDFRTQGSTQVAALLFNFWAKEK